MLESTSLMAAIAGAAGAAAAVALLLLLTLLLRFRFRFRLRRPSSSSPTGSSPPSAASGGMKSEARQFGTEEMEHATMDFSHGNVIGSGGFGVVFKGLLHDGTAVAVKRRHAAPTQLFIHQVAYLSSIQHRNLVTLLGYCQERGTQVLVFEYLPNTTISTHLYGIDSTTKLEFKQRLSIAIGAAKDAGLHKLLEEGDDDDHDAGSSCSNSPFNAFKDPEYRVGGSFQDRSDVYSFGVFLIELITGKEASNDSIHQWKMQESVELDEVIDQQLIGSFTEEGMRKLMKLVMKCTSFPGRERPRMESVATELDRVLEREITRTTVTGDGTTVTLGSQLFKN